MDFLPLFQLTRILRDPGEERKSSLVMKLTVGVTSKLGGKRQFLGQFN